MKKKKINKHESLGEKCRHLVNKWDYDKNKKSPFDYKYGSNKEVWWKCLKCNYEWEARIASRVGNNCGCPICAESKGEKRIREWLEQNGVQFESQKKFDGLTGLGDGLLSYDFYLPTYNLLIEYQGEFHDGNGNYFVRQNLEYQKEHDKRKKEYAKQNGINLLEIWYWDFDNIEEILKRELNLVIHKT